MAEQQHQTGSMDISEQERTFAGFMNWTKRVVYVVAGILLFLAIFAA